ncbi:hypothetical protein FRACYDRAFT_193234 [Fragilariopsis cylindrus CCMP1102]|uniref:Helicase-associated domain-containing protein n=1 Tax=Fragilariopsis cylindrus CCMP1102 TaxID=635003 RepID=A0A1E7EY86_9STRA|nr:hypothetical protein FRACYDRAFT_193234 [Fragilariopsis cylindrus CCMP1102]|eukprot:OEU10988.1 hypothetical protein FRACYDRAFT_193234 [Fragilariopsis cylindrus CCMP1102]
MIKVEAENGIKRKKTSETSATKTLESPLTTSKNKKRCVDGEESGSVVVSLEVYIIKLQKENAEVKAENVEVKTENFEVKAKIAELEALVETLKLRHSNQEEEEEDDEDDIVSDDDDSKEDQSNPWNIKYKQLLQYRMVNGDCRVPGGYKQNPQLGRWVMNQRQSYNNVQTGKKGGSGKISQERIEKLDSIGFFWGVKYSTGTERSFKEYISELQKYKNTIGNFDVHPNHELGKWISRLRAEYKMLKKGRPALITLDQIQELKEIGFRWKRQTK